MIVGVIKPSQDHNTKYLVWVKQHLAQRHPVVMFIFCKGDSHRSHGGEKGYGFYDLIEPVVYHQQPFIRSWLSDLDIFYGDDQLTSHSDWDQKFYVRPFSSMYDTPPIRWKLCKCDTDRRWPKRGLPLHTRTS